jgi:DNA-binding CsgD family transcriptional regulator/PAS domain-containing protein
VVDGLVLSTLIGLIYDCALDPSRWDEALAHIKDALDCQNVVLHLSDLRRNRVLIQRNVGLEPYWLEQFAKHVPELHALLPPQPALDEPRVLSRHNADVVLGVSPFVRDWLRPQGIADVMQLFLIHTPSRFSGLGLAWSDRHGFVTDRDLELACLLLPHLRRAVTISDVLDARTIERARMAEALDALRCAVVMTDARGAILHANNSAERMLRNGGPVQDTGGVLQARDPSAAAELRAAVKLAARDGADLGKAGLAISLTEPGMPPVFAHVLPLTSGDLRTPQPEAVAAVFISTPPDEQDGAAAAAAAFELTRAETRVLASLLAGATLAETAVALGIAPSTAKTHLDNIFSKTGVTRQADLMRLATGLVPPTRSTT